MLKAKKIKSEDTMIEIDASQGEGGGQILRTALSLSILTQTSVRLMNIRAKRPKPGLMRQHLTCVRAAAAITQAEVKGDELGSSDLYFHPGQVYGGEYEFAIGTAGSCALVLQTVLWPLLFADLPSRVTIDGGTHVGMAPSFEFLKWSFIPALTKMGMNVEVFLGKHGFYPGGGGKLHANIKPWSERNALDLQTRGEYIGQQALCLTANLDHNISSKQLSEVTRHLEWSEDNLKHQGLRNSHGIGNALMLSVQMAGHTEVASAYGDKTKSSEYVAQRACDEIKRYLRSDAAIGEHLADQLLIPLALAGGKFSTNVISEHLSTNIAIIELFLTVKFNIQQMGEHHYIVEVK